MTRAGVNRYNARRDANEPEIVALFEAAGWSVYRLSKPLDLLVSTTQGVTFLVEVKTPKGKLKPSQADFIRTWPGKCYVCKCAIEAQAIVQAEAIKA